MVVDLIVTAAFVLIGLSPAMVLLEMRYRADRFPKDHPRRRRGRNP